MKKGFILSLLLAAGLMAFAQQAAPQWNRVLSNTPESYRIQLVSSTEQSIQVNVQVPGFYTANVTTPRGEAKVITMPKAVSTARAGEPDVPMTGIPVLIGDKARMSIRVIDAQYIDFEGIEVAPSKGDFPRTINPEDVPYTYGACYSEDAFFPANNVGLYEPYIIRDFRGQNMVVFPYAYNPASKTLRVYYNMTVEMYKVDDHGSNTIETRRSNVVKMDPDFKSLYKRHFINYEAAMNRYTPLDEEGDLLIICYDSFMNNMTDFINWKKTRGINTTIVGTSTAGSSYSAIKTYIQNQYNANNNLTHVLLVGDVAQIPGYSYSGGGSSYSGLGDNAYGQIVGSDIYNDVFIGRFSASSAARVNTQAQRVITYERDLTTSATWLKVGEGISRKEGGSGHNSEDDYQHMNNIRTDLLNYGYTPVYQRYANLSGYDGSSATISSDINSGVGIINYTNHGQETAWGANSSGYIYYSVSHVNALTNENKLPFIWSVACLVGKYDHSSDCFAEAWMNATNNSNPTGAIGTLMSYISQPWIPPMWAQDECVDILVDSYSSNIKHTWGGTSINGLMGIFDHYSTSEQQAVGTYQAWILYGDPSLMLRTKTPTSMTVTHDGTIAPSATSYNVTVSNGNGAVATITDANHNILGKATVSGTSVSVPISGTLTAGTELTLCVFGFNKVTYLGTISVVGGTQYTINVTANPTSGGTVSGAGTYYENTQCTLTATPNTGYTFTNWKKGNTVVSTDATYTFTVSSSTSGSYTATFTAIPQYTISVNANPTAGGTVTGGGTFYEGTSCTLTATTNVGYTFTNWTKNGTVVSTNPTYTFTVTGSGSYTANFAAIPQYTITATANPTAGGTVSGGGTFYQGTSCTLTATANNGYAFTNWTKNGSQVSTNPTYTFTVTAAGNYVANFDQLTSHSVTCNTVEGGTIGANVSTAYPGDVVTLTATANTGYFFSEWNVRDANNNPITVTDNQFTMPNSNVTVSATFVQGCTVTIAEVEHGTVTATPTTAVPGTTITLTATPETNYLLSSWIVYKTGDVREGVTVTGNSFVLPAFDVTVVGIFKMIKEADVAIGNGSSTNIYLPTYSYYKYSLTQQIYTAAEIGQAGTITKIAFKVSNSKSTSRTVDVYLKHTTQSAFTSQTGWEIMRGSDKVYSGSVTFQASGWTTITLSTPFEYDGTSNLVLCVDDNTGSYVSSNSNSPQFYVYSTNANRAMRYYSDSTNPSATSPSSVSGTYITSNNQVTFTMTLPGSDASLAVSPNAMADFSYIEGNGPSAVKSFAVIGTYLTGDVTVTAPTDFEISDAENGNYGSSLTFAANRDGRETLSYDFEGGAQGWTTLKGSTGNSPNNWMHVNDYTPRDYTSGYGNNQTDGWMLSESYISASTEGNGTAVTPDNYLVSPQVTLGGSITFWVTNGNSSYGAEHFALLVSTTNNTNISSFTQVQEWTLAGKGAKGTRSFSDHTWYEYTVDLSAYSGAGYVAFRHFNCNDQWILGLDDVTIVQPEDNPVNPTDPTVELLMANVYVRLKEGLSHGSYANETLTVATGDITSNVNLNGEVTQPEQVEQTVTLNEGWNWWAPTVETTMEAVQAALGSYVLHIESQNGQTNGTIAPGQMLRIETNAECQLSLTGTPITSASITINQGLTWFGYVGAEKSIAEAFSGFTPTEGDKIVSQDQGFVIFNGTTWDGDLSTLIPGRGYVYISAASNSKQMNLGSNE